MIKVKFQNKTYEFKFEKAKAKELLKKLNLSSTYAVVLKNGEIVTEDEILTETDNIEVISAISGGQQQNNVK